MVEQPNKNEGIIGTVQNAALDVANTAYEKVENIISSGMDPQSQEFITLNNNLSKNSKELTSTIDTMQSAFGNKEKEIYNQIYPEIKKQLEANVGKTVLALEDQLRGGYELTARYIATTSTVAIAEETGKLSQGALIFKSIGRIWEDAGKNNANLWDHIKAAASELVHVFDYAVKLGTEDAVKGASTTLATLGFGEASIKQIASTMYDKSLESKGVAADAASKEALLASLDTSANTKAQQDIRTNIAKEHTNTTSPQKLDNVTLENPNTLSMPNTYNQYLEAASAATLMTAPPLNTDVAVTSSQMRTDRTYLQDGEIISALRQGLAGKANPVYDALYETFRTEEAKTGMVGASLEDATKERVQEFSRKFNFSAMGNPNERTLTPEEVAAYGITRAEVYEKWQAQPGRYNQQDLADFIKAAPATTRYYSNEEVRQLVESDSPIMAEHMQATSTKLRNQYPNATDAQIHTLAQKELVSEYSRGLISSIFHDNKSAISDIPIPDNAQLQALQLQAVNELINTNSKSSNVLASDYINGVRQHFTIAELAGNPDLSMAILHHNNPLGLEQEQRESLLTQLKTTPQSDMPSGISRTIIDEKLPALRESGFHASSVNTSEDAKRAMQHPTLAELQALHTSKLPLKEMGGRDAIGEAITDKENQLKAQDKTNVDPSSVLVESVKIPGSDDMKKPIVGVANMLHKGATEESLPASPTIIQLPKDLEELKQYNQDNKQAKNNNLPHEKNNSTIKGVNI